MPEEKKKKTDLVAHSHTTPGVAVSSWSFSGLQRAVVAGASGAVILVCNFCTEGHAVVP